MTAPNPDRDAHDDATLSRAMLGSGYSPTVVEALLDRVLRASRRLSPQWLFRLLWGQENRPDRPR